MEHRPHMRRLAVSLEREIERLEADVRSLRQRLGEGQDEGVEERLRPLESDELFRVAFFGIPDLAGITDYATGRFIEVNEGCERVLGWTREEVIGRTAGELPIWASREERRRVLRLLTDEPEVPVLELDLRRKDGQLSHVAGSARRVEIGGRQCVVLIMRDETERRRAEQARRALEDELRQLNADLERRVAERTAQLTREIQEHRAAQASLARSEHEYRELVESANSIILRLDPEGRVTFLNPFGQRFFGYTSEELIGRHVIGTIIPERETTSNRDLIQFVQDLVRDPARFATSENENMRRDGERRWISWTNRPIVDGSGKVVELLCVGNDITGLKEAELQARRARDAAESADRLKSAFLATMSHELRTPLNSIIGFTGILLQGLAGPLNDEQRKQLGMVQAGARHLLALINDVLDLSKIEAGQLQVQRARFDLRASLARVVQTMRPQAERKGLEVRLRIAPEVGEITSDQRRVEQVLMNLLSNAIKFTERGEIEVASGLEDGQVATSVRDTGIGIKPEDQALLFRPFQQVDTGLARAHEGTGLGLSICRRLLELLGGSIRVQSTYGAGSVFTFALPLLAGEGPWPGRPSS